MQATNTNDIAVARRDVESVLAEMKELSVTDGEQAKQAGEFLTRVKLTQQIVTAVFEPERKRTYAEYQEVLKARDELTKPLERAEREVKRMISAWRTEEERKRREAEAAARKAEEERRLAEAMETGNEEVLEKPIFAPQTPEPQKLDGISYMDVWRYEIVDEFKLPRAFLVPDEKAIARHVRENKGATQIPGVRVYCEKVVRAGAR